MGIFLLYFYQHFLKLRFKEQELCVVVAIHFLGQKGGLKYSHSQTEDSFLDQSIFTVHSIEIQYFLRRIEVFGVIGISIVLIDHILV